MLDLRKMLRFFIEAIIFVCCMASPIVAIIIYYEIAKRVKGIKEDY